MGFFYSSDDTEFIRRFLAAAITHGFSRMRPVRSLQIPPEVGKSPTDFTDIHRYLLGRFFSHADFADDAVFFFSWDFFFHRISRNLFGDFLLRRLLTDFRRCDLSGRCRYPLRLEKVPQISQIYTDFFIGVFCPTDFTDIHRYLLGRFFSHADFADDADFFSWDFFIHRTTRNLFGDFLLRRLLTDFRRGDLFGRCRYPLRLDKEIHQRFHRKSV